MYSLASPQCYSTLNDFAVTLLTSFVDHIGQLYGCEFLFYNIHGLTHVSDDVKIHGHLDCRSGFPFENYLRKLKKMVRRPHSPFAQVVCRLSELGSTDMSGKLNFRSTRILRGQHTDRCNCVLGKQSVSLKRYLILLS